MQGSARNRYSQYHRDGERRPSPHLAKMENEIHLYLELRAPGMQRAPGIRRNTAEMD